MRNYPQPEALVHTVLNLGARTHAVIGTDATLKTSATKFKKAREVVTVFAHIHHDRPRDAAGLC